MSSQNDELKARIAELEAEVERLKASHKWTDEERLKMSAKMKALYADGTLKGRKWTEAEKAEMSVKMKAKTPVGQGRKWTEAEKAKMRETMLAKSNALKVALAELAELKGQK